MKTSQVKAIIKYLVILAVTGALLWIAFSNIEVDEGETKLGFISKVWGTANKPFMILSGLVALLSHLIRAERWKLLLSPMDYHIKTRDSFMSVMVGYFVNLAIPRGGEVSRCYNLYRLNKTPINISIGTVISERVIDLIFLITLISTAFFVELDALISFFKTIELNSTQGGTGKLIIWLLAGAIFLVGLTYLGFKVLLSTQRMFVLKVIVKFKDLFLGVKKGVKVVFRLRKRKLFIIYSLSIWVCYYFMSYFVMMAFPDTSHLTMLAALTIFVIGGIAMTIPLPGGTGSYHVLVPAGLVFLYNIPDNKAIAFTVIFHAWHTIIIIVTGAICMLIIQSKAKYRLNGRNKK